MNCCIIGGTGFIGHHLIKKLSRNRDITIIGRNRKPTRTIPEGIRYTAGDYGDRGFLKGALKDCDEVIHLAYTSVPETSYNNPIDDVIENIIPSINLFEVCLELSIKRIILISSGGTVYGRTYNRPIPEFHPTNPISPYGITKLAIEKYAFFYLNKGLPIIVIRPSNVYGEGQTPFIGQGFITTAICSALKGKIIKVYGDSCIRDLIYIDDIVDGIIRVLNYGELGHCYNIGSELGISNSEIIKLIYSMSIKKNIELFIEIHEQRPFDVRYNILNCDKIRKELDWRPKTLLAEGFTKTWDYYKKEILNG